MNYISLIGTTLHLRVFHFKVEEFNLIKSKLNEIGVSLYELLFVTDFYEQLEKILDSKLVNTFEGLCLDRVSSIELKQKGSKRIKYPIINQINENLFPIFKVSNKELFDIPNDGILIYAYEKGKGLGKKLSFDKTINSTLEIELVISKFSKYNFVDINLPFKSSIKNRDYVVQESRIIEVNLE